MPAPDLHRLVQIVVEELAAATAVPPAVRCECHGRLSECCPERVGGVLAAGASRLGLHASGGAAADVARLIDHTQLKPDATRGDIETLCREAAEYGFATVCVNPTWVALCARLLRGSEVRVCSVAGFPLGATTPDVKQYEARRAIFDGTCEVDMMINIGALKSGDLALAERDIEAVTAPCGEAGVLSKVIIEAALLTDEEKVAACTMARAAGADYVKTSTGFGPGGATAADVSLMRRIVGDRMGVKAAGGIRDLQQLQDVAGADVAQRPALGGHDESSAIQRSAGGRGRDVRIGRAQRAQPREALDVAVAGEHVDQRPAAIGGGDQPGKRGPDEVGADG